VLKPIKFSATSSHLASIIGAVAFMLYLDMYNL
jgi:hypothetical protein